MNESRCKACDAELVYVGSLFKGGVLKCPHCDSKDDKGRHVHPAHGNSYLYANTQDPEDQFPCEYCGTFHKIWESCPDEDGA